jgi:elongation factor G
MIVEPYVEGMPTPQMYKFGNQEFKISIRDTQEIDLDWGGKLVFINSIVGGSIDARFLPAILKGIMDKMEQGRPRYSGICVRWQDAPGGFQRNFL